MIKISKLSDLEGAEKYGTCTVCHKNSNDGELYSITLGNEGYKYREIVQGLYDPIDYRIACNNW